MFEVINKAQSEIKNNIRKILRLLEDRSKQGSLKDE